MSEQIFIVTGANPGLGKASASLLAQAGHQVVLLCRSRQRGEVTRGEILRKSESSNVNLMLADLASQASIRAFASDFYQRYMHLAIAPGLAGQTGKYFVQENEAQSSPESYDPEVARRLWQASEELVGQKFL